MSKRFLAFLILIPCLLGASEFPSRLYLEGYYPLTYNKVNIYKIDKGLNIYKAKPYYITGLDIDRKERIDFEIRKVVISTKVADQSIYPDVILSFDQYIANMQKVAFRKSLTANIKQQTQTTQVTTSGLIGEFVLDLPSIAIPKAVQKVLGNKAGRLNLDGTQKVTLQASSTKRKQIPIYETQKKSTFDIKMEQETNLRLSGTIGEKIGVNLKYNSKQDEQIFDPNNINVKYTGDEDEVVRSIEAGNITLALSGSRYISYSTSSQGLFGVTSKFKYGNLDLSVIASKEEGQKNTQTYVGKSQADSTVFRSRDYASRTMYYITDPYALYDIFSAQNIGSNPPGWINNAIRTDPSGAWYIKYPGFLPENGSMRLFMDDANAQNNIGTAPGDTIFFSQFDYYVPYYEELIEGTDFITDYSGGFITVLRAIDRRTTLAITYTRKDGLPVQSADYTAESSIPGNDLIYPFVIRRRNQEYDPDDPNNVWHYQMRNVYNMNKTNIKNDGFLLNVYTLNADNTRNYNLPDSLNTGQFITYTDYLRLDSSGDGLINGDDTTVNLSSGLIMFPFIEPFKPFGENIIYEEESESVSYLDINYYITVQGKIGREAIELSQGGILRGSVRVRVNGTEQRENVDYLVDYDFGRITFLTAAGKDPDAKIEIDYENRSLFSVSKKTLAGFRADWKLTDYAKLGGTVIYRSETVADKRPRIGNENIQMWMANVDGNLSFKPAFMTRFVDALPLISTSSESQIDLSGEIAYTIPTIYGDPDGKKKESYLDDMESIMDSYPLGVTFSTWVMGSKPFGTSLAKGKINWYNPKNIRRDQVEEPSTLNEREKKETVTVLALKHTPNNLYMPGSGVQSYSGIMKYLGNQLDFSQKKYIELFVKVDHKGSTPFPSVTMNVDLGDINEDFYTEYGGLNALNSEDKNKDGVLTLDEDVGLDGIPFGEPGHDPFDKASSEIDSNGDYPKINGTEANRVLDTEDLDGNGVLNQLDRYFSYSISLADTTGQNHDGWVLYRIPLNDSDYYTIVSNQTTGVDPSLKKISYARIWLQCDTEARVYIADASIVGNKWQDFLIRNAAGVHLQPSEIAAYNSSYLSGIVNNQKNSNHYTSPPGTVYMEERRESSESALSLDIANLQSDNQVLLRQRMIDAYNLLSYEKIRYWVYPEAGEHSVYPNELDVYFRIGADSLNYYQVTQRIPVIPHNTKMDQFSWKELEYDLQDITSLKERTPGATMDTLKVGDVTYFYKGSPTLTNIRELYVGVMNPSAIESPNVFNGTVYFNDMRVVNPFQDIGVAQRVSFNTRFADFATFDVEYESKSENFNPVIQRGRTNSFTQTQTLNMSNKYFLNKFFPNAWGLDIPVTLRRNYTFGAPRYRANSDLLISNIPDEATREREKTENLAYLLDFGYSQRTAPKSKILQYTLAKVTLSGNLENRFNKTSTAADTTFTWRGTMGYNLNIPPEKVSFKIWKNYKLGFFPSAFTNSFTLNSNQPKSWNWEKRENVYDWYQRTQTVPTKLFTSDNSLTWGLTSDLNATARFNTKRDLNQKEYLKDINIGKQTEYVQDLGLNFNPNYFPRLMTVSSAATARYSDMLRKYYTNTSAGQLDVFQRDGNTNRTFRTNISMMNSTLLSSYAQKLKSKIQSQTAKEITDGSKPKDQDWKKEMEYQGDNSEEENRRKEEEKRIEEERKLREEAENNFDEDGVKKFIEDMENDKTDEFREDIDSIYIETGVSNPDKVIASEKKPGLNPYILLIDYLARVKNITASYQNAYTMNYARKTELPPFAFQIGIPYSMPRDSLEAIGNDNTITVASGLILGRNLDSTLNFSHSFNKRYSSASQQNTATTFPDVTLSLMNWEKWVGLANYIENTRLNTSFQYTVRASGDIDWVKPKQESITLSMSPLVGITANVMKVVTTNLSLSVSQTTNTTAMDGYNIIKSTNSQTLNGNFSYSFSAGRGFTIPFTGKKIHIRNQLTSSLGLVYENNFDETEGRAATQVDRSSSRLAITPSATYQFDQNIRGGLTSSYEISSDRKRDDGTSTFRLGIWVEVNL